MRTLRGRFTIRRGERAPGTAREAGFTLMELMLAMALFSLLSVGLVSLLSRSTNLLADGNSGVATLDSLQVFSEIVERDVTTLYTQRDADSGMPDVRLYADTANSKFDTEDDEAVTPVRRFMFVRMIPNEATSPLTRRAGVGVGQDAQAYLDQKEDNIEALEGRLRPTGGQMEVFYTAIPDSTDDPAVMSLYRGIRAPIGGEGSLLPTRSAIDPSATVDNRGPLHLAEVQSVADRVLTGVLYFGVEFWGRKTQSWDTAIRPPAGPSLTWDSTRGILPSGKSADAFHLAKPGIGPDSSKNDPVDDVFPRRIRVTLVVEEVGPNASTGVLAEDLGTDTKTVPLLSAQFIPLIEGAKRYVKIGTEWIEFVGRSGNTLTGCSRGARGTTAQVHLEGSVVHHGRTLVREFAVPTYRDTYQEDLSTNVNFR